MTRRSVCQYPGRQQPIESLVVYWCSRVNGWWPGVARACPTCRGFLDADPPDGATVGPGRVYCIDCGREWAEVRDKPPRVLTEAERAAIRNEGERRGRPPGRQSPSALQAQRERLAARTAAS